MSVINLQKPRTQTMIKDKRVCEVNDMADSQENSQTGTSRALYPALAVTAIAGLAVAYLFMARKTKGVEDRLSLDKVVNLCNSAADKLDAYVAHSLAG
ncbi:MAG TPA: hypothetical protein VHE55_12780 [Fimbriimonadaceae bacterium]|nr:hypothetical protein [Fimbriimonadaceae bacterium]